MIGHQRATRAAGTVLAIAGSIATGIATGIAIGHVGAPDPEPVIALPDPTISAIVERTPRASRDDRPAQRDVRATAISHTPATAGARPARADGQAGVWDLDWAALAWCESRGQVRIVSADGRYHGLYQFDVPTWRSVGGRGLPSQASHAEQTARAQALYRLRGTQPWPTCGGVL